MGCASKNYPYVLIICYQFQYEEGSIYYAQMTIMVNEMYNEHIALMGRNCILNYKLIGIKLQRQLT